VATNSSEVQRLEVSHESVAVFEAVVGHSGTSSEPSRSNSIVSVGGNIEDAAISALEKSRPELPPSLAGQV